MSDKVREHCYLTGKYRGLAHSKCRNNVTQVKSNFIPFVFHSFSTYDCHMFFKKLIDKRKDKVKFKFVPETNEKYISIKVGCIRFIDSYRFLSSRLDSLVKTLLDFNHKTLKNFEDEIVDNDEILKIVNEIKMLITEGVYKNDSIKDFKKDYPDENEKLEEVLLKYFGENDLKLLKTEFPENWKFLSKKLVYPYEFLNCIKDYQKSVGHLRKEDFFSKLKNDYPSDKEIERTKQLIKSFNVRNVEELTQLYLRGDVFLFACVLLEICKSIS